MEKYYVFIILAFVSEVLGTISGFGSSILFVPIASLFFDFKSVLGITAVFHVFSNLSKIALFRNGINKYIALKLGIPAVIFVTIGAYITTFLPTQQIELAMNFILVFLAIYFMVNFNKTVQQTDANLYIGGIASGFIAGGALMGVVSASMRFGGLNLMMPESWTGSSMAEWLSLVMYAALIWYFVRSVMKSRTK